MQGRLPSYSIYQIKKKSQKNLTNKQRQPFTFWLIPGKCVLRQKLQRELIWYVPWPSYSGNKSLFYVPWCSASDRKVTAYVLGFTFKFLNLRCMVFWRKKKSLIFCRNKRLRQVFNYSSQKLFQICMHFSSRSKAIWFI